MPLDREQMCCYGLGPAQHLSQALPRYEAHIEHGLYKALYELQRLQAARTGQPVLAPVAVDVGLARGQFRRRKPLQAKPKLTGAASESMVIAEQLVAVMGERPNREFRLTAKMHSNQHSRQPGTRQDIIHLGILLAIALCIGIYLIATTVSISRDSTVYIEYARNFASAPIETMLEKSLHPGYSVMILGAHKIAGLFSQSESVFDWIRSAQSATLVFRVLAIAVLYLLGKDLVGPRFSFWAVLIIILLPKSAQYGSDALSDWPHLFFLATGFLLLIRAATSRKLYLFALTGIVTGLGYLIRPECAQLIIYGFGWLGLGFLAGRTLGRSKAVLAAVLLLVGFLVVAGPYMALKATPLPEQNIDIRRDVANIGLSKTAEAVVKLGGNIGDTLEWIFVPAWIIGLYRYFRKTSLYKAQQFFIMALVVLNVLLMVWLYTTHSYMDKRHSFPLVLFTIYCVPGGLELLASWLGNIKSKKAKPATSNQQLVFYVLLAIGIAVCVPQLLRPLNYEKLFLRKTAQWIASNTDERDLISASDPRIAFYAERRDIRHSKQTDQEVLKYAVTVLKLKNNGLAENDASPGTVVFSLESRDEKSRVVVYAKQY